MAWALAVIKITKAIYFLKHYAIAISFDLYILVTFISIDPKENICNSPVITRSNYVL